MCNCLYYPLSLVLTGDSVVILTRLRLFSMNFYTTQTAVSIGGNGATRGSERQEERRGELLLQRNTLRWA